MKPSNLSIDQVNEKLRQEQRPQVPKFTPEQIFKFLVDSKKRIVLTIDKGFKIPDEVKIGVWRKDNAEDSEKRKSGPCRTWLVVTTAEEASHRFTFRHASAGDITVHAVLRKNKNIAGAVLQIEDLRWRDHENNLSRWRQFEVIASKPSKYDEDSEHEESGGEEDEDDIEEEKEAEASESPSEKHGSKRPRPPPPVHVDLAGELNRRQANPSPNKQQKSKPVDNAPEIAADWKSLFENVRADAALAEATEAEFTRRMESIALEMAMNLEPIKQKALEQLNLRYDEKLTAVIAESKAAVEKRLLDPKSEFYVTTVAASKDKIMQEVEEKEGAEIRRVTRAGIAARARQAAELEAFNERRTVDPNKEASFQEIDGLAESLKDTFDSRLAQL